MQDRIIAYLPNINGDYKPRPIPIRIQDILSHVTNLYDFTYQLTGANPIRPNYGIPSDLEYLGKWCRRYFSEFTIKKIVTMRNNYYGIFEMTDPVAYALEKVHLLNVNNNISYSFKKVN